MAISWKVGGLAGGDSITERGMGFDDDLVEEVENGERAAAQGGAPLLLRRVLSVPLPSVLDPLRRRTRQSPSAALRYARALFLTLGPSARQDMVQSQSILLESSLILLDFLHNNNSDSSSSDNVVASECLNLILHELPALPRPRLSILLEAVFSHFECCSSGGGGDGSTLVLISRCFGLLTAGDGDVAMPENDFLVSFAEYRSLTVQRMLAIPWPKTMLIQLAGIIREMPLEIAQLSSLANAIYTQLGVAEPHDLPALAYQMLLLASSSSGPKRVIMLGFLHHFSLLLRADPGKKPHLPPEVSRQIEGTIVLHVNFAVKQDPTLGNEILYLLRTQNLPMTPFAISMLLSVARIQRFEEASISLLKSLSIKCYQDSRHCRISKWMPPKMRLECIQAVNLLEKSFMLTVQNTAYGWDHVIPSLVRVAFSLIEAGQPGETSVEHDSFGKSNAIGGIKDLGVSILRIAFEVHDMSRDEIIEQSKCRIIGMKPEQSAPIIQMLGKLVREYPHIMLEHVARLKECLEYFTFFHPTSASSLIRNICPLFQLSNDLQNYTVLVLRKAIFGRDTISRMTALQGVLSLIISEKQLKDGNDMDTLTQSASEASCSQQNIYHNRKSAPLLLELKGLLRRCLSQQANIRETLYKGLVKLVLVDPTAADSVFDLLWPHFCLFYKACENTLASLDVSSCVKLQNESLHLEEPLDYLLYTLHTLLAFQPQEANGPTSELSDTCLGFSLSQDHEKRVTSGESLHAAFASLRNSMRSSTLGDFNLDKSQSFSMEAVEGKANLERARILLGIFEVFIDTVLSEMVNSGREANMDMEIELKSYVSFYDVLEQITLQKQGTGGGRSFLKSASDTNRSRSSESANHHGNTAVKHLPCMSVHAVDRRMPFLRASNIAHLLHLVLNFNRDSVPANSQVGSQQRSFEKEKTAYDFKVATLALGSCLQLLKSISSDLSVEDFSYSFKVVVGGDWKILGNPILQFITAAVSTPTGIFSHASETLKDKEKSGKNRKNLDESRDGLTLTAMKCLDEICRLAKKKNCLIEVLRGMCPDLVNDSSADLRPAEDLQDGSESSVESNLSHQWLTKKARPLLQELLHQSRYREFEVLAGTMMFLGSKLPGWQKQVHAIWAEATCRSFKLTNTVAAKALITMSVSLSASPKDVIVARGIAEEVVKVMGTDERDPVEVSDLYPIINASTRNGVVGILLQYLETALVDVEWLTSKLKLQPLVKLLLDLPPEFQASFQREDSRLDLLSALHERITGLVSLLSNFVCMSLSGASAEHVLRVAVRLYKCLAAVTKLCIAPKGYKQPLPSKQFQMLAEVACKRLTAPLYSFVAVMQRDQQENQQAKGSVSKIKREGRMIPNLIFHVEDYERYLIQLSKLTRVNLMRQAKRSTARDFKILDLGKKKQQSNDEDEEAGGGGQDDDAAVPADREAASEGEDNSGEEIEAENAEPVEMETGEASGGNSASDEDEGVRFRRSKKRVNKRLVEDDDDDDDSESI